MIDSATLFESVLEAAPDACVVFDSKLRVLFANRRFHAYAAAPGALVGRSYDDLWPDEAPATRERVRQAHGEGVAASFEVFSSRLERWFVLTASPIPVGVAVFYRDITEAKRAETALTVREARYRELMRQSPLSVQIISPNGWTQWVNDSFTHLWGATLEDLAEYNILRDPQLDELGLREPLARAFAGEAVLLPLRRYDGGRVRPHMGVRQVRAMAYPVRDDAGQVVEVVLTHEDVTEIVEAEERLKNQERELHAILEGIGAARWEEDLLTGTAAWSPELYELLNLPTTLTPHVERFIERLHPDDRPAVRKAIETAVATCGTVDLEFRVRVPERGERWMASVGRVLPGPDGRAARMVGINFDVTDRVLTRTALERTEQSLALAMKGGRMGYWTREFPHGERREDDYVEWSPELEEVFGLAPGTFAGTADGFMAFVHPDDRAEIAADVERAIAEGTDYTTQFRYRHADGTWRWMEGRGRATYDERGRPLRLDGIGIDITAQKAAEEARREVEDRFRRLADSLPAIVWGTDAEGHVTYLNEHWVRYTGIDLATYHREGMAQVIHPDDLPLVSATWQNSRRDEIAFRIEARYRRHDGSYRWFLASAVPTRDAEGRLIGWFGTATDIQDQKYTESTLRLLVQLAEATRTEDDPLAVIATTERLLRIHLGANRCAYAEVEEDNDHFSVEMDDCEGCASIVGRYPLASFGPRALRDLRAGRPYVVRDIDSDVDRPEDLSAYRQTQIQAVVCVSLVKEERMVGLMAVHQTTPRQWTDEEIALVQMVADRTWSDMARARANRRLATSETQYREIAETLPQLVWSTRPNGYHDYFNSRWYEYIGVDRGETDGEGWSDKLHPDDREQTAAVWQRSLETGEPYEIEYRFRRYDGEYRWFLARALPIRDAAGRIVRWFGTCTDIQEQKDAAAVLEARVRERTAELEAANREMEGFTYSVSHDLRAPLRAIMATSLIVLQEAGDKLNREERELLARQAHNARRLGILIDELLQMSRLGRSELKRAPVDLAALAREVAQELREDGRGGDVWFEIPAMLPAHGDASLLRFVVLNLLDNAAKFSPKESTVTFGVTEQGAYFVRDHGIGFDPRFAHKLFLPFERLVSESDFPGTGIGLANVKRIVDRHGGEVWAESQPGEGATFFFTLPGLG
jgi:PAS domain S-box-containing protein